MPYTAYDCVCCRETINHGATPVLLHLGAVLLQPVAIDYTGLPKLVRHLLERGAQEICAGCFAEQLGRWHADGLFELEPAPAPPGPMDPDGWIPPHLEEELRARGASGDLLQSGDSPLE